MKIFPACIISGLDKFNLHSYRFTRMNEHQINIKKETGIYITYNS